MSAYTDDPQTRVEAILQNILGKNNLLQPPQTRVEELLLLILNQGLGGVTYKGVTTTELTDGSTTNPIIIDGNEVEAKTGDFVAYDGKEFVWNGEAWQELGDLELVVAVMSSIAPQYISTKTYNTGDRVYQDNILYECDDNNVTGEFNPLKWHQITITQILAEIDNNIQSIFGMISDTYDPDETYNIGRLVIHNKKLYKCKANDTTGAWNASKWDETSVAAQLNEIRSAIANLTDAVNGLIDDNSTSTDTTWSSSKISSEISSGVQDIIDDTTSSSDSTWSSEKIEEEIDNKSVTKTATGNPIELTDAADAPLVKCTTEIQGSQDLHGYDKPWVGGAGYNKCDEEWEIGGFNVGTGVPYPATDRLRSKNFIPVLASTSYYLCMPEGVQGLVVCYDSSYNIIDTNPQYGYSRSFGTPSGCAYIKIGLGGAYGTTYHDDVAFNYPSTVTTYSPYSNICPISAYTEGEIEVRGKNIACLLPSTMENDRVTNGITFHALSESEIQISGTATANAYMTDAISYATLKLLDKKYKAGTYTISSDLPHLNANTYLYITAYSLDGTSLGTITNAIYKDNPYVLTLAQDIYANIQIIVGSGAVITNPISVKFQLEKGSTATDYEPYTSTTHTTTYPSAIYRGSEDCVKGEVESEWILVDLDSLSWSLRYEGEINKTISASLPVVFNRLVELDCICEQYAYIGGVDSASVLSNPDNFPIGLRSYKTNQQPPTTTGTIFIVTDKTINSYGKIAYKVNTPTTEQVTVSNLPIRTISGYNHIESSTGDMEIEYITEPEQPILDLINSAIELPHVTSSDNGKVLTVVNGLWDKALAPHIYSTTEQVIGKWIDGSDLYEKILQFTSTSTSDTLTSVAHSIANVSMIYIETAFVVGSSYTQEMAPFGGLTGNDWFQGAVNSTSFDYQVGTDFVSCPVYVILRYTKSA